MATDPFQVFRESPGKHKTLLALWPALHAALAGPEHPEQKKTRPCVMADCAGQKPPVPAVARTSRWGHTACAKHVNAYADRPGGWPLDLKEHKR